MTIWQRWVHRPQSLWARKALFQIHLWIGIGVGLYVLAISISGSAIVYRSELSRRSARPLVIVNESGRRLTSEEVSETAQRAYPAYEVYSVFEPEQRDRPDQVVLGNGKKRISRLFDPYTGADLGDPQPFVRGALGWLVDLHDNLLAGRTGRLWNGIGALMVTLLSLTGVVIWWPGIKNWRRSLSINRTARFARVNWDLHSAVGFWCSLFVMVWGVSGICLCFPGLLNPLLSNTGIYWLTRLHFGRFNVATKALWTVVGLAPATLAVTGALMWWNRVLSKKLARE